MTVLPAHKMNKKLEELDTQSLESDNISFKVQGTKKIPQEVTAVLTPKRTMVLKLTTEHLKMIPG